ncbi:uncharacterized protein LOC119402038 isoform X2 [Rhipicephalus sanguineus]|nr:uncharacterized protein LOC119402038 isoform X2 [Rhipicephalus sanguineus]
MIYVWGHGWEYRFHREGTPCWLTPIRNSVGYCSQGICIANNSAGAPSCSGQGYITTCNSTTCDGMPCINIFTKPSSAIAGICKNRMTYQEQRLAHHHTYLKCKEKENYGRNVLFNCHHYCKVGDTWYHGYYSSNLTSSCYLAKSTPTQDLGWCCEGRCIEKAHCLAS